MPLRKGSFMASQWVRNVDATEFDTEVIETSRQRPVVVDFWASWCGPCQALGPALERVAEEYQGRFQLAKVDADRNQDLAAQYGVRGIPAVKALVDGAVVDAFTGALPEPQIREFIDRILPSEEDKSVARARQALAEGRLAEAEEELQAVLAGDPHHGRALMLLARLRLRQSRPGDAAEAIRALPARYEGDPEVAGLRSRIEFARIAAEAGSEEAAREALDADPGDLNARYRLAAFRILAEDHEAAFEHLLEIVRRDRGFREDAGRKGMLALFELLGNRHPLVSDYRKRLSRELF